MKKTTTKANEPILLKKEFRALMETPIPEGKALLGILRLWIYLRIVCGLSAARIKNILVGDLKSGIIRLTKTGKDVLDIRKIKKQMVIPFFDFTDPSVKAFDCIDKNVLKYQLRGLGRCCGFNRKVTITEKLAHMTNTKVEFLGDILSMKMIKEFYNQNHYKL